MNINSRILWTTLVALLVAAVAIVTVAAQEPPPAGRQGSARGKGLGPAAAPVLQRLNLTDEQRQQIRGILEQQRQGDQTAAKKLAELRRDLQAAVFADTPDRSKIDQLEADLAKAEAAALHVRIETDLKIAQILTPEQRAKAREDQGGRAGRPRR